MAQAVVYIDGFNLYYGLLKKSPYKMGGFERIVRPDAAGGPNSTDQIFHGQG